MFTFNNNSISGSYSMRPKKDKNPIDYVNINNDNFNENNNILNVDLKSINFENISVELALNVLQLKHNKYYEMTQQDMIQHYNEKIKLNNNINSILALKIILKYKFKDTNISVNKLNGINLDDIKIDNKINNKIDNKIDVNDNYNNFNKTLIEQKNKISNGQVKQNDFLIIQNGKKTNLGDFKITQIDTKQINNNHHNKGSNSNKQLKNNSLTNTLENNKYNFKETANNTVYNDIVNINSNQNITNSKIKYINTHSHPQTHPQTQQQTYTQHTHTQPHTHTHSQTNTHNNHFETYNGLQVTKSSEYDIDSIINSYSQKKISGLIR
jgi:hypothetical protein